MLPVSLVIPRFVKVFWILWFGIWIMTVLVFQKWWGWPIYGWLGLVPQKVLHEGWVWQLLSYGWLHSENPFHLLFNGILFWFLAAQMESVFGWFTYVWFWGLGSVLAAIFYIAFAALGYWTGAWDVWSIPVVGSSAGVMALLAAFGWEWRHRPIWLFFVVPIKALHFVAIILIFEILSVLSLGARSNTAHFAHVGGLAAGSLLWWLYRWRNRNPKPRLRVISNDDLDQPSPSRFFN